MITSIDKDDALHSLEIMCERCTNHGVCMGTGCRPVTELYQVIIEWADYETKGKDGEK